MWKVLVASGLALALGAMVGGVAVQAKLRPTIASFQDEQAKTAAENAALKRQVQDAEMRLTRLENENASLYSQLEDARALAEARAVEAVDPVAELAFAEPEDPIEPMAAPPPRSPAERRERGSGDRDRDRGERRDRWEGAGDWGSMTPEEREARRQEFAARARQRIDEMTAAEMAKTSDAAAQQRLAALNEQLNYMMDLTQSMREAQTEEERQVLRDSMAQARDTIRELSEQQQDYMLRQLASQFGITSPAVQDQFIASLRETQDAPFFQGPRAFTRGGWGGFPGGGFGGGGGQPGGNSAPPPRR